MWMGWRAPLTAAAQLLGKDAAFESLHPRGETTDASTPGSFAPKNDASDNAPVPTDPAAQRALVYHTTREMGFTKASRVRFLSQPSDHPHSFAAYHPDTDEIEIYPRLFDSPEIKTQAQVRGVLAHEIMHRNYQHVLELYQGGNYLARQTLEKYFRDKDFFFRLRDADGVTPYSAQHWIAAAGVQSNEQYDDMARVAIEETIAEIARRRVTGRATLPARSKVWDEYYNDIVRVYNQIPIPE